MNTLFASTWGNPNATKRVFLTHGIMSSSTAWYDVASEFASRGWFVTAPDLLGHGHAKRGSDYTIASLADGLRPFFTPALEGGDHPYDIVVGHSLGGVVVAALLPYLKSTRPVHVVLVDPPLDVTPEFHAFATKEFTGALKKPKSAAEHQRDNPSWAYKETVIRSANEHLCDATAVATIMDKNRPWSFSHLLLATPDNVKLTVLAADPGAGACVTEEQLKPYPNVTTKTVWGSSHDMQRDDPLAIVEAALEQSGPGN